jgi:hypothetical protein
MVTEEELLSTAVDVIAELLVDRARVTGAQGG